jgi:flagellin-like protein
MRTFCLKPKCLSAVVGLLVLVAFAFGAAGQCVEIRAQIETER